MYLQLLENTYIDSISLKTSVSNKHHEYYIQAIIKRNLLCIKALTTYYSVVALESHLIPIHSE